MQTLNLLLLASGLLVFTSLLAGMLSARLGLPFLLVFLAAGMFVGADGPIGVPFDNTQLSAWVGNAALAMILLEGGISTRTQTFRAGSKPALTLATLGVALTASMVGAVAMAVMNVDWRHGLLLGARGVARLLRKLPLTAEHGGVLSLIIVSSGMAVFGTAGLLEGSGFLAIYLFGLLVRERAEQATHAASSALDGFAWAAQATMFLLLSLLVSPRDSYRFFNAAFVVVLASVLLQGTTLGWVAKLLRVVLPPELPAPDPAAP